MSIENERTIEVYEKFGANYLDRNSDDIKNNPRAKKNHDRHVAQLKKFLDNVPKNAKIFEVGSAGGRDAKIFRMLGYENLVTSDVVEYFLNLLKVEGLSPIKFNLISDEFPEKYDIIYCWAVLVHFKKTEAKDAIRKMFDALKDNGKLIFCVQSRDGFEEDWVDRDNKIGAKRYFSYWEIDELEKFLMKVGFKNINIETHVGTRSCWLECVAEK